jgi:arylsulfatase A-like enzyme
LVADHGEEFGDHGGWYHGQLYDELVHVPLIMVFPPALPKGRTVDAQVRSIDIVPTIFDILSIAPHERNTVQGQSLIPVIAGESGEHRDAVSESCKVGQGDSIRTGTYKLIYKKSSGTSELYDISLDPSEKNNLAEEEPEVTEELRERLNDMLHESAEHFSVEPEIVTLDEETTKALKALGYLE